jgi:cytochrome c oxidase assembly protein subunit 15
MIGDPRALDLGSAVLYKKCFSGSGFRRRSLKHAPGPRVISDGRTDPWRHRYALFLSGATVLLLAAGGLVTSTGSGLAVPDWPLSFGQVFPPMQNGVLFEHGHRLIAATIGILTVVLALWFARREPRAWVRRLAWMAVAAVVAQGLLGGLTVLLRLPPAVSVAHALLAQAFFGLCVTMAVVTGPTWLADGSPLDDPGRPPLHVLAAAAAGIVYVQTFLGAWMRHTGAGLAIPDVPLMFGQVVPPFASPGIVVHFTHRVVAILAAALVFWLSARAARHRDRMEIALPARLAATLVLLQILLGAASVLSRLGVVPTTLHVVNGALLLAALLVTALYAARRRERRARALRVRAESTVTA